MSADIQPTPGPWEAIKGAEEGDEMRCAVVAKRGKLAYLIASIENGAPGDFCDTEWANARLIAAAPDLLAACETNRIALVAIADSALEAGFDRLADIIDEQLAKCNAAIARARGEPA